MLLLVGDNADGVPADARVTAEQRLAVLGLVFVESAAVDDAREHVAHVVGLRRIGFEDSVQLFSGIFRRLRLAMVEGRARAVRSEEHTSELQSHSFILYAVFC